MAELIHQFPAPVRSRDGVAFVAQAWANSGDGCQAWLVFIAADGKILRTAGETSHATLEAARAWAERLRPRALRAALDQAIAPSARRPAA